MSAGIKLFELDRHEAVVDGTWDEERARLEIVQIAKSAAGARGIDGLWLGPEGLAASLYAGAAGIVWSAHVLAERGYQVERDAFSLPDLGDGGPAWKGYDGAFKEYDVPMSASWLLGPAGTLGLEWKLTQDHTILDRLDTLIGDNQSHPWMENLWGAPSTMLAAHHLFQATGQERFADHIRSGAHYLEERLIHCEAADCLLWDIELYGQQSMLLGAGHGFVGNVFPILKGCNHLSDSQFEKWQEIIVDTTVKTAQRDSGFVNWPPSIGRPRPGRGAPIVQHCHGAPGFVIGLISLFGLGHAAFDEVLLEAGELIWQAGALNKYPGLCHGTSGNGYAFLKLWQATGDEKWLTRARGFAMMSIEQRTARLEAGEVSQCSLWEGDMGLAMYLADCIEERSAFPTLDYF